LIQVLIIVTNDNIVCNIIYNNNSDRDNSNILVRMIIQYYGILINIY